MIERLNSLPMYIPSEFDMSVARDCAQRTSYAYDMYTQWSNRGKPRKETGFTWKPPSDTGLSFSSPLWSTRKLLYFNESELFGCVALDASARGCLVFLGTESAGDWLVNADTDQHPYDLVPGYGSVHDGLLMLYKSMRIDLFRSFDEVGRINVLLITGHSLGCGLSTVAVPDVMAQNTFQGVQHDDLASPWVGDPTFTTANNSNGVLTYRVVDTCDLVVHLPTAILGPFLYKHIGAPVNFTAQYGSLAGNHSLGDSYQCALSHPGAPGNETTPGA